MPDCRKGDSVDTILNGFIYLSAFVCFFIAGVIWFLLHRPVKEPVKEEGEKKKETCKGCNREQTYQRLENLETGELLPFCIRCSRWKTFDSDKYLLRSIRTDSGLELPADRPTHDTRKTEYSVPF